MNYCVGSKKNRAFKLDTKGWDKQKAPNDSRSSGAFW